MGEISGQLHDFILKNEEQMIEEWLAMRSSQRNSIYSTQASAETVEKLKKETGGFIEAVTAIFVHNEEESLAYVENWASTVAKERAQQSVPLYEVMEQLGQVRRIYWNYVRKFFDEVEEATSQDALRWSEMLNDIFDFIIESFARYHHEAHQRLLASHQEVIDELSSPVIPIRKGVGILPLVGGIDTYRAKVILETALVESSKQQLSTLYIDLSAVPIVDTMVAQQLFQLMDSLRIIGVESVLSGIRPEIAQTAVTLGIDFKNIKVYANLMQALDALEH
ncbi:STAS domain-containing protein [Planococcus sp. ISL-109]|uniref:STAS domain-containing protein n=1 Tax=Planococcus sp. ISL-109 TaxID=2819166 RepID=UPI001BE73F27|nr:STAS domain-containing protein [Planococcus sp. ISL-109]MBT2581397.1 STAS domain-containing protein [Planococcus sp. ISL-109]